MEFHYFDVKHAVEVQDHIIRQSGGRGGILNRGLLESVLEFIQNDSYYPELEDKVCHLFFAINKNHAFNDGNKRSSIALSAYFLEINGHKNLIGRYIREMENIAVLVADNKIGRELLHQIICELLYRTEFTEHLRFELMRALM